MRHTVIEAVENGFLVKMLENEEVVEMCLVKTRDEAIQFSQKYFRSLDENKQQLLKESND